MTLWRTYEDFSPAFVAKHHDFVIWDAYHHVKACFLYPPCCACAKPCHCKEFREKIFFSLNLDIYNQAEATNVDLKRLRIMRLVLGISEDNFWRKHYVEAYPLWLIDQEFQKQEKEKHFKAVSRLVWTLLRLAHTYEMSVLKERQASMTEALEVILGKTPLKMASKDDYLCGEKAYGKYFADYRSICHFIAASEKIREEGINPLYLNNPDQITQFLEHSEGLRRHLLS